MEFEIACSACLVVIQEWDTVCPSCGLGRYIVPASDVWFENGEVI